MFTGEARGTHRSNRAVRACRTREAHGALFTSEAGRTHRSNRAVRARRTHRSNRAVEARRTHEAHGALFTGEAGRTHRSNRAVGAHRTDQPLRTHRTFRALRALEAHLSLGAFRSLRAGLALGADLAGLAREPLRAGIALEADLALEPFRSLRADVTLGADLALEALRSLRAGLARLAGRTDGAHETRRIAHPLAVLVDDVNLADRQRARMNVAADVAASEREWHAAHLRARRHLVVLTHGDPQEPLRPVQDAGVQGAELAEAHREIAVLELDCMDFDPGGLLGVRARVQREADLERLGDRLVVGIEQPPLVGDRGRDRGGRHRRDGHGADRQRGGEDALLNGPVPHCLLHAAPTGPDWSRYDDDDETPWFMGCPNVNSIRYDPLLPTPLAPTHSDFTAPSDDTPPPAPPIGPMFVVPVCPV